MATQGSDGSMSRGSPGAAPRGGIPAYLFDRVMVYLNSIGSIWIFALTILINTDAFGRKLFAAPINGVPEIIELSIVGIVFLQLGDATRHGRLTRSDGLFKAIQKRWPAIGRALGALFDLLGALFMSLILYGSVPLFIESVEKDFYVGVEGLFTAPVWPVKLIIVIGCIVTLLQFLVFAWRYLRISKVEVPPEAAHTID
jgi:TRAP-type mannitol/chloroaromatic compound transport system permease small subunit